MDPVVGDALGVEAGGEQGGGLGAGRVAAVDVRDARLGSDLKRGRDEVKIDLH